MNAVAIANHMLREHTRTGLSAGHLKRAIVDNLMYEQRKYPAVATDLDFYLAVASAVRDRLLQRWVNTARTYRQNDVRVVCYLSAEYLLGPHLANNLLNLGIQTQAWQAIEELGLNVQTILDEEQEPGLGNGGLGRLASASDLNA
jgi:starch phosphorylase